MGELRGSIAWIKSKCLVLYLFVKSKHLRIDSQCLVSSGLPVMEPGASLTSKHYWINMHGGEG